MNAITPTVTEGPLPASRKVYKSGTLHPFVRVPMREISVHPTSGEQPVTVYDSSVLHCANGDECDLMCNSNSSRPESQL